MEELLQPPFTNALSGGVVMMMLFPLYLVGFGVAAVAWWKRPLIGRLVLAATAVPILLQAGLWSIRETTGYAGGERGGIVDTLVNGAVFIGLFASPFAAVSAIIFMLAAGYRREIPGSVA